METAECIIILIQLKNSDRRVDLDCNSNKVMIAFESEFPHKITIWFKEIPQMQEGPLDLKLSEGQHARGVHF